MLLAGSVGGLGNLDGPADVARFSAPRGVAVDRAGVAYVTDGNAIRSVSPAGEVKTLAGRTDAAGYTDGPPGSARFHLPIGIAVHSSGDLIVADNQNKVLRRVTPSGLVSTFAGSGASGSDDGPALEATLDGPVHVLTDRLGNVYFSDWNTIRRIDASGSVTTLAVADKFLTRGPDAFLSISAFAFDAQGVLHVLDGALRRFVRVSSSGTPTLIAQFPPPSSNYASLNVADMVFGTDGNFYAPVNDTIWRILPTGTVEILAGRWNEGSATVDGTGAEAGFQTARGIAVDIGGDLLVTETFAGTIRRVGTTDGKVTTLAGQPVARAHRDGVRSDARFARLEHQSSGLVVTQAGTLLLADDLQVRAIDPQGLTTTVMQSPAFSLHYPLTLTADPAGKLIVAGSSPAFRTGDGRTGELPGAPAVANASALAMDESGNLYASVNEFAPVGRKLIRPDELVGSQLRHLSPAGQATVLAGDSLKLGSTDGSGSSALFSDVRGIAVDRDGTVYLADRANHAIRRIAPDGTVSTWVGKAGEPGAVDGPRAIARLNQPVDVALDPTGVLYVAEAGNQLVRRVGPDGNVTTIVGTPGSVGVRLGALPASLGDLSAIAVDGIRLYIATRSAVLVAVP